MSLKIFNTMSGKKENFVPKKENQVGMYVCGVTVYDYCHVGHARSAIVFDTIYRYLQSATTALNGRTRKSSRSGRISFYYLPDCQGRRWLRNGTRVGRGGRTGIEALIASVLRRSISEGARLPALSALMERWVRAGLSGQPAY